LAAGAALRFAGNSESCPKKIDFKLAEATAGAASRELFAGIGARLRLEPDFGADRF
jgi:hypothetical protein